MRGYQLKYLWRMSNNANESSYIHSLLGTHDLPCVTLASPVFLSGFHLEYRHVSRDMLLYSKENTNASVVTNGN